MMLLKMSRQKVGISEPSYGVVRDLKRHHMCIHLYHNGTYTRRFATIAHLEYLSILVVQPFLFIDCYCHNIILTVRIFAVLMIITGICC